MTSGRRAFGLTELLVALGLSTVVLLSIWSVFNAAGRAAAPGSHAGLQLGTQLALLELDQRLAESIELVRPSPGTSLSYFVVRGNTNEMVVGYQVVDPAASTAAGQPIYDLWLAVTRKNAPPEQKRLLQHIERMRFTATSPGVLQLHAELVEDGKTTAMLTSVRLRNLASEGQF